MPPIKYAIAIALFIVGAAPAAFAGYHDPPLEVRVTPSTRIAYGCLSAGRASGDSVQYIGCSVYGDSDGSHTIECWARSATGEFLSCSSNSGTTNLGGLVAAVSTMNSSASITFAANKDGGCASIRVTTTSSIPPMVP
jgi:hypothetical protein